METLARSSPPTPTMRRIDESPPAAGHAALALASAMVRNALADRATFDACIEIKLDDHSGFLVDGPSRTVRPLGGPCDCSFLVRPQDLTRIIRGEIEPRHAMLFGQIKLRSGQPRTAIALCDHLAGRTVRQRLGGAPALPAPTRDWDRARQDLAEFGYALVEGALSPAEVDALRRRTVEQAAGEVEAGVATISSAAQHLWTLLNKGQIYHDLLLNPVIDAFVPELLGDHFILNSITGSIGLPGNSSSTMHIDQSNVQPPIRQIAFGLNVLWFLDDVSAANGGTRLMPGSHVQDIAPLDPFDISDTVAAEGPAGTALLLDSRVWHCVGPNSTDRRRHVLVTYFNRYFMRAHENHFLSLRAEVEANLHEKVRVMCGFRCTGSVGGVEGPIEGQMNRRLEAPVGTLSPRQAVYDV